MSAVADSGPLRLGVIGMSEGNGHPYSWSAIFNGYDREAMASCPFPAIPQYLGQRSFPRDALSGARVTHVWTQDRALSEHIARASLIPNIAPQLESLVGEVDGVLLARDDAEHHREHADVFLRAGVPIYIDKPLSLSRRQAQELFSRARYAGQIFSCTALRYAQELQLTAAHREQVGELRFIDAVVPKEWDTYAVHVIEPVLALLPESDSVLRHNCSAGTGVTQLSVTWKSGVQTRFTATGAAAGPIAISVYGVHGSVQLTFCDAFSAFKSALAQFIVSMKTRQSVISQETMLQVVELIELGRV